jgi:hypothetical protein
MRFDTFSEGIRSIVSVLRPIRPGWDELPGAQQFTMGFPARSYWHREHNLFVISAVETMQDEDKGPEYHLSISKPVRPGVTDRCSSAEAAWVLLQFALEGAEEDNHVPHGKVRNFWRPVANPLVGLECPCKADEPAIVEDKGDFVWRPIS